MEQRLRQCVKVEKPLEGGKKHRAKKGFIYYWTEDGRRWFRHNERAYRSNRQIRGLERKIAKNYKQIKIELQSNRHGELPDSYNSGGLPIKTFPLVFGDGRRADHPRLEQLRKEIADLKRHNNELQGLVAMRSEADIRPTDFILELGTTIAQEYSRPSGEKMLGIRIAGEAEIVLTRAQWQNALEFQEVLRDVLTQYGEHIKRLTMSYSRVPAPAPTKPPPGPGN